MEGGWLGVCVCAHLMHVYIYITQCMLLLYASAEGGRLEVCVCVRTFDAHVHYTMYVTSLRL